MTELPDLRRLLELQDEDVLEQLYEPKFEKATRVHDWRNYVPKPLKGYWKDLSVESRLIVYAMAERQAMAEEWD